MTPDDLLDLLAMLALVLLLGAIAAGLRALLAVPV